MRPGEPADDFTLPSFYNGGETEMFKLSSLRGKFVLILFYPVDFGFVTPTEFYELETFMPEFAKNNCEVIAVSTEHIVRYTPFYSKVICPPTPTAPPNFLKNEFKCPLRKVCFSVVY